MLVYLSICVYLPTQFCPLFCFPLISFDFQSFPFPFLFLPSLSLPLSQLSSLLILSDDAPQILSALHCFILPLHTCSSYLYQVSEPLVGLLFLVMIKSVMVCYGVVKGCQYVWCGVCDVVCDLPIVHLRWMWCVVWYGYVVRLDVVVVVWCLAGNAALK